MNTFFHNDMSFLSLGNKRWSLNHEATTQGSPSPFKLLAAKACSSSISQTYHVCISSISANTLQTTITDKAKFIKKKKGHRNKLCHPICISDARQSVFLPPILLIHSQWTPAYTYGPIIDSCKRHHSANSLWVCLWILMQLYAQESNNNIQLASKYINLLILDLGIIITLSFHSLKLSMSSTHLKLTLFQY